MIIVIIIIMYILDCDYYCHICWLRSVRLHRPAAFAYASDIVQGRALSAAACLRHSRKNVSTSDTMLHIEFSGCECHRWGFTGCLDGSSSVAGKLVWLYQFGLFSDIFARCPPFDSIVDVVNERVRNVKIYSKKSNPLRFFNSFFQQMLGISVRNFTNVFSLPPMHT